MTGLTAAQALEDYRRAMQDHGELATLRRGGGFETDIDVEVYVKALPGASAVELSGGSFSTRRRYLILLDNMGTWPLPIERNDQLIVGGRTLFVIVVDDALRRIAGTQIAVEVEVAGA